MNREMVIVGAGPAGMAAAVRAGAGGVAVTVVDEAPAPGGQIYRRPPEAFNISAEPSGPEKARGEALLGDFHEARERIEFLADTVVLGLFEGRRLLLAHEGGTREISAEVLVLACGAYERTVPFPGWTLPGVLTAGGCQVLLKSQRILPGRRVLVAGTGPLLPVVACQLARAGAEVAAVLEASSLRSIWQAPHLLLGQTALLREGLGYLRELRRAGIPYLQRHAVLEVHGDEEVEEAVITRLDRQWRPIRRGRRALAVDTVAVGFGFVSNTELSRMALCEHSWLPGAGGWVPVRDPWMETSQAGIYAAGDGAGVAGALAAEDEGTLAALGALFHLGRLEQGAAEAEARVPRRRLRKIARFRKVMDRVSEIRPGLLELCRPETVVCRCEEVTRAEIAKAVGEGAHSLDNLKRRTRAGMGFCQGRVCLPTVSALAALGTQGVGQLSEEQAGWNRPRPPLRPVTIEALAGLLEQAEE